MFAGLPEAGVFRHVPLPLVPRRRPFDRACRFLSVLIMILALRAQASDNVALHNDTPRRYPHRAAGWSGRLAGSAVWSVPRRR